MAINSLLQIGNDSLLANSRAMTHPGLCERHARRVGSRKRSGRQLGSPGRGSSRDILSWCKPVLAGVALAAIALSCYFALEFGFTRGSTLQTQWAFGIFAVLADLTKATILLVTVGRASAERVAAWAAFVLLTCMSLWCAAGMTAVQLAERTSKREVALIEKESRQATLDRLIAQRNSVPEFTPTNPEAVDTAKTAVSAAAQHAQAERDRGGCKKLCREREEAERQARVGLQKAQDNLALSVQAAQLDAKIEVAETAFAQMDLTTALRPVDPQSLAMARAFGLSEDAVALVGHAFFALVVEVCSGLLPWLLCGHGQENPAPPKVRRDRSARPPASADEKAHSAREKFFGTVVLSAPGERVSARDMHRAYVDWCGRNKLAPMSVQPFGTKSPWAGKRRKGGNVWYVDCRLPPIYANARLRLATATEGNALGMEQKS